MKVSGVEGGGTGVVTEMGRWREKKVERRRSVHGLH